MTKTALLKTACVALLMAGLAACSSLKKDNISINDANASMDSDAQVTGAGDETRFGDHPGGMRTAANTYYFDFDSNAVHDQDRPKIETHADRLMASNAKATLEGHTDPRGSREYNIGLGERRAKAVKEIMVSKGVNPSQVRVVSYGAEKRAASGHSESDYQLDRRAVYVNNA